MNWHKLDIGAIVSGTHPNGAPYLIEFLKDYKKEFNVDIVNPSCERCLKNYHNKFIKKYEAMDNTSQYRLHKKREGLQLEFGSSTFVSNNNITDAYAEQLIKRFKAVKKDFKLSDLFDKYPTEQIELIEPIIETSQEETTQKEVVKKTRKPRKKRK